MTIPLIKQEEKKAGVQDFFFFKVSSSILTLSLPCQCNRSLLYIAAKHFWWTDHTSVNLKPFLKRCSHVDKRERSVY